MEQKSCLRISAALGDSGSSLSGRERAACGPRSNETEYQRTWWQTVILPRDSGAAGRDVEDTVY